MEAAGGPSDSCLTQDEESSSDTPGPQPNGHHAHGPSMEEESSNEPPVAPRSPKDPAPKEEEPPSASKDETRHEDVVEPQPKAEEPQARDTEEAPETATEEAPREVEAEAPMEAPMDAPMEAPMEVLVLGGAACVNGDASMDSLDSESHVQSSKAEERTTGVRGEGSEAGQEGAPHDGDTIPRPAAAENGGTQGLPLQAERTGAETGCEEQDGGGGAEGSQCKRSQLEKSSGPADPAEAEPQLIPPPPPLIVDRQGLSDLLEEVVRRSQGYSVDQLERLYSQLSQCVYQHRQDYDKTRLLQEMVRTVQRFATFPWVA